MGKLIRIIQVVCREYTDSRGQVQRTYDVSWIEESGSGSAPPARTVEEALAKVRTEIDRE